MAAQIHGIRNQTILYCRSRLPYLSFQSLILFQKTAPHLITAILLRMTCPSCRLQVLNEKGRRLCLISRTLIRRSLTFLFFQSLTCPRQSLRQNRTMHLTYRPSPLNCRAMMCRR
ncbi:hypothetical protein J4G37_30250 [Microvirga sp. 3-52]|nr:hypothetical protein [Microvirga sp. 3-52]